MTIQKEIEYSFEVDCLEPYIKYLERIEALKKVELKITRDIYKNDSKYFIKVSQENSVGVDKYIFSAKEDLMKRGKFSGLKVSDEIDIELNKNQLAKLVSFIKVLGFKKDTSFKKKRISYKKDNLSIDLDTYFYDGGNKYYVEVEGDNKSSIKKFVSEMKLAVNS